MDAIAFDFVFGDELVGAVLKNDAVRGFLLGRDGNDEEQGEDGWQ